MKESAEDRRRRIAGELPIARMLESESFRFEFFQAVRLLAKLYPERQPVGGDALPRDEVVRFSSRITLEFPASQIHDLKFPDETVKTAAMLLSFMGLAGASGVLPRHYTELLLERAKERDFVLRDFLDLFNHRLASLFYRAWEKYRGWLSFERAEVVGDRRRKEGPEAFRVFILRERPQIDRLFQCFLDLTGTGEPLLRYRPIAGRGLESRRAYSDKTLAYYSGLLAQQHRCAKSLENMLIDHFEVPIRISQFCGDWLTLDPEDQSHFAALDGNMTLGSDVVVGERVWDFQGKFRVVVGPLNWKQFQRFLPDGADFQPLTHLTRLYAGSQLEFDVQLVLRHDEVPMSRLSGPEESGSRLGWDSWVGNEAFAHDACEAVFATGRL